MMAVVVLMLRLRLVLSSLTDWPSLRTALGSLCHPRRAADFEKPLTEPESVSRIIGDATFLPQASIEHGRFVMSPSARGRWPRGAEALLEALRRIYF
jgi:hypothetical protein